MSEFEKHFSSVYQERWPKLREAMLKPSPKLAYSCFNGFATYHLDAASVKVASFLPLEPSDFVLDMCAAPGGKALVLFEAWNTKAKGTGEFVANELSFARRKRLEEVVRQHVPAELRSGIKVGGWDASKIGIKTPGRFDKILLDAPCSSERHLLEQNEEMTEWKLSRTKQLAQRQYALICSAILALKPGGTLVYSTCSISPFENDGVIERLLDRKSDQVELDASLRVDSSSFEKTNFGFQIFPDLNEGQGPLYFSRLTKKK